MNKSDSKYYNTACLMDEALIILLETKDYNYITVKEICEKAGVNRSTFYLHYETINDLLEECIDYITKKFMSYIPLDSQAIMKRIKNCDLEELYFITPEYLDPYLKFTKDYKRVFNVYLKHCELFKVTTIYNQLFKYVFDPILERFNLPKNERQYMMTFYINGLIAIIREWILNDCKEEITEIINIINKCVQKIK